MYFLHGESEECEDYRRQQLGFQICFGCCVTSWNLPKKDTNIPKQSQSWSSQQLNNGRAFYHDVAQFPTISYSPSVLWVATHSRRSPCCLLPLLYRRKDCTCVNYLQGLWWSHETVLFLTSAVQGSSPCYRVVCLVDCQASFSQQEGKTVVRRHTWWWYGGISTGILVCVRPDRNTGYFVRCVCLTSHFTAVHSD